MSHLEIKTAISSRVCSEFEFDIFILRTWLMLVRGELHPHTCTCRHHGSFLTWEGSSAHLTVASCSDLHHLSSRGNQTDTVWCPLSELIVSHLYDVGLPAYDRTVPMICGGWVPRNTNFPGPSATFWHQSYFKLSGWRTWFSWSMPFCGGVRTRSCLPCQWPIPIVPITWTRRSHMCITSSKIWLPSFSEHLCHPGGRRPCTKNRKKINIPGASYGKASVIGLGIYPQSHKCKLAPVRCVFGGVGCDLSLIRRVGVKEVKAWPQFLRSRKAYRYALACGISELHFPGLQ